MFLPKVGLVEDSSATFNSLDKIFLVITEFQVWQNCRQGRNMLSFAGRDLTQTSKANCF